ncbi:MAG: 50S ribosomal protein L25 [Spirochaetia bacterium]|jgi:large subunit ribosomal protein L25|nr:50S ribosomal protein L25 [Spirochaetia bacterium]
MSEMTFNAHRRTSDFGSAGSRRLVRAGKIPAVIYGHVAPQHIVLDAHEFEIAVGKLTESTLIVLDVDGEKYEVLLKEFQDDLLSDTIRHIDFYAVKRGEKLRAYVPIIAKGNPVGCREGGVLDVVLHEIEVECLPKDLPSEIIVDVSGLGINQHLAVKDLQLGAGITIHHNLADTVASVKTVKAEVEPATPESANAEAEVIGAAPADGTAPAEE